MTSTLPATRPAGVTARPGAILAVLLTGQFMAVLDLTIVNVAAPSIRADLHASGAGLQLVVAGYTITYAVLLITGARLGDRYGAARAFRIGLAGFTAASLACALAGTTTQLVAFRLLQGAAAAVMMPQVLSLIQRTFAGPARARALSLYAAVIACGTVVGQVLGGVLVGADLLGTGWRPTFAVNVPVGVLLLVLGGRWLPADHGQPGRRLDPAGLAALSAAVLALVVPLVLGREEGWPAWCQALLLVGVLLVVGFAAVQRAVAARGGAPLVPPGLLRAPGLVPGAVTMFLLMLAYAGYLFSMTLHLQSGLGDSATRTGLLFAPAAVGFAGTGLTWRRLPARLHGPIIPAGLAASAGCYLLLAALLRGGRPIGPAAEFDLLLLGLALGLAFSPVLTVALGRVPVADAADASGVLVTSAQLGLVVGVATVGTLYLSLVDGPGAAASGHAVAVTGVVLAAGSLAAAAVATLLVRPRRALDGAAAAE